MPSAPDPTASAVFKRIEVPTALPGPMNKKGNVASITSARPPEINSPVPAQVGFVPKEAFSTPTGRYMLFPVIGFFIPDLANTISPVG